MQPVPTPFNLAAYILSAGAATPDKPALEILGHVTQVWTYAQLAASVSGTAAGLLQAGAQPGDRILLRLGNGPGFPFAFLGAIAVGMIPVPTSSQLTLPEINQIARTIRPRLTVAGDNVALPDAPGTIVPEASMVLDGAVPPPFVMGDPDRPAYIVYTSGTSGQPRAVVHAHRAVWARRMMWEGWYGLQSTDRLLHAGAFNWTYTLGTGLMDPWSVGATALIPGPDTASTDLPSLLARSDATIFAAAPGIYRQMLRTAFPALPTLRHGLSAGEKMPALTRDAWQAATGTAVHEAFGMSECSTFISGSPARPAPAGSLGFSQSGRRVALIGPDGPVGQGAPGTISIHRTDPGLMLGYLDQPDETAAKFQGDWFLTGDIGTMDADGAITYQGRTDDMLNAGGVRVSPIEIESALAQHPGIVEAAAVELRITAATTIIGAFWTGPDDLDDAALTAFATTRLADYKCPRLWRRVTALPRGANNKLLRRKLRTDWEAAHGQA